MMSEICTSCNRIGDGMLTIHPDCYAKLKSRIRNLEKQLLSANVPVEKVSVNDE